MRRRPREHFCGISPTCAKVPTSGTSPVPGKKRPSLRPCAAAAKSSIIGPSPTPHPRERRGRTELIDEHETTSAAAGWAVYCLATHPRWQEHAREEAAAIAAQPDAALVEGLSVLPAIVQETLRLYPPATISARRTEHPFTIHGVNVSVGDMVIFSPYITHRDPRVHAQPTHFDPARWLDGTRPDPGTYLPWGGGAHRCLGSHMATTELIVMLAHLIAAGPFQPAGRRPRAHGFAAMRPNHATIIRTKTDS